MDEDMMEGGEMNGLVRHGRRRRDNRENPTARHSYIQLWSPHILPQSDQSPLLSPPPESLIRLHPLCHYNFPSIRGERSLAVPFFTLLFRSWREFSSNSDRASSPSTTSWLLLDLINPDLT
ncbi:hypothetical protein PV05_08611 [Exophiala xenobiotica]|uniref:Uncharacterized protein n=1 Tax=Exophiala xenobiotica TaxID=348802 RepID=A0A0D2BKK9_9EURO|nr:uncharacterized protein PV05_08611 [Exophiala xenobiotica]KIW53006.1 hypothetical protein PV05_08611 [Exophiala xenobiotica]